MKILYSAYACHRDTENTELFIIFVGSDFSHELQLIAFIYIWFRLDGELRCRSRPCDLPFGSASQHKFIPDEFVFACPKKSNQKKRHPNQFAPSGFPQHSPLPTGRPDSPSGLDMTKSGVLPDFPYQRRMLRQTSWGGKPYKRRSLDVTKWNPGF